MGQKRNLPTLRRQILCSLMHSWKHEGGNVAMCSLRADVFCALDEYELLNYELKYIDLMNLSK